MPYFDDLKGLGTLADGGGDARQGGIVFAFIYRQPSKSKEEIKGSTRFRFAYAGDTFVKAVQDRAPEAERYVRSFLSEAELRAGWHELATFAQRSSKRILAGAIMSHASNAPLGGTGENFGIETARGRGGEDNDGTLSPNEISSLPRLPWARGGFLVLCGCHTGDPSSIKGQSVADFFARQQGVPTVGQRGSAAFSKTWDRFSAHDGSDLTDTVYLWAYDRGGNNRLGSGMRNKGYLARVV